MSAVLTKKEKGIGSLTRLGFSTLSDCLLAVPKEYRDFTNPITDISKSDMDKKCAYRMKFLSYVMFDDNNKMTRAPRDCRRLQLTFEDSAGLTFITSVFGGAFAWKDVIYSKSPETFALLWARFDTYNGKPTLKEVELMHSSIYGQVLPVYAGKIGRVSAAKVHEGVVNAMGLIEESAMTLVAKTGVRDHQFTKLAGMHARDFLQTLHQPKTFEEGEYVRKLSSKIATFGLVQSAVDYRIKVPNARASIKISGEVVASLVSGLPFSLTNDQTKAVQDIVQGLREPFPLLDLISADVGVGKSITFMIPSAAAAMAGSRVGIMAPSTLLAEQLSDEMRAYFPHLNVQLVTPGDKITGDVCIGTTALIGAAKRTKIRFDLIVVDEQHKFGAEQRAALIQDYTNLIESTATPIPRSIALVSYGGYRLIHMTECPVKKAIFTRVVKRENGKSAMEFIVEQVKLGGQAAIVYSGVESTEDGDGKNVKDAALRWEKRFPGRVGVIHGKLSEEEKARVIRAMKDKEYDVLISSSIIEVGITLSSLKIMAVVEADYFGLAQLHQLRGRVARKGGKGYCFLFPSENAAEDAFARLQILEQCTDGYELAERDMENRGFGNLDSDADSQHGKTSTILWNAKIDPKKIEYMAKNLTKILAEIE